MRCNLQAGRLRYSRDCLCGREPSAVHELLLDKLTAHLAGLAFPAGKDEVLERLDDSGAGPDLVALVQAMPGQDFAFASDVVSTARIALELGIREPWPQRSAAEARYTSDETCSSALRQRLQQCRQANGHLVKVTVRDGMVYLDGRAPDVPRGVWAVKCAVGFVPLQQVVNRLHVTS